MAIHDSTFECLSTETLKQFLRGELTKPDEIAVAQHLGDCVACEEQAESFYRQIDIRQLQNILRSPVADFESASIDQWKRVAVRRINANWQPDQPPEPAPQTDEMPQRLGRFALRGRLGAGGFGVVYLAYDEMLLREVALKLPRAAASRDPQQRARFLREARAAAALHHPHIIPVFEAGVVGKTCYLSSEYCAGLSLSAWLRQQVQPVTPQIAAEIIRALADAVAHAHEQGILHRDIKPGNILLSPIETPNEDFCYSPKLTDFGMAKLLEADDHSATESGVLIGTPRYMAPEQATGRASEVGRQTDVYGLGVVLYELLTGRVPIEGGDNADTLRRIVVEEPPDPSKLAPHVPRDLEAICLKCLRKAAALRYATAAELADDLRRFLVGEPVSARPLSHWARCRRWLRRHPAVAGICGTTMLAALLLIAGLVYHTAQLDSALLRVAASEGETRELLYLADMKLAAQAWEAGDTREVAERLLRHQPKPGGHDLRKTEWSLMWNASHGRHVRLHNHEENVYFVRYSPDGRWLASCDDSGKVCLCDAETLELRHAWSTVQVEVNGLAFSPDCEKLATAGDDGTIRIWNLADLRQLVSFDAYEKGAYNVLFTPDGNELVTAGRHREIRFWDLETGNPRDTIEVGNCAVDSIDISADGHWLAGGCDDGIARLWDLQTKRLLHEWPLSDRVAKVRFSADASLLAVGVISGDASVFRMSDYSEVMTARSLDGVYSIAITGDNRWLAFGDRMGILRLISLADDSKQSLKRSGAPPPLTWDSGTRRTWSIEFSPDGQQLAVAGRRGTVSVWNLDTARQARPLRTDGGFLLNSVALSPGRLATCGKKTLTLWDVPRRRPLKSAETANGPWHAIAADAEGSTIAVGNDHGIIELYDASTLKPIAAWSRGDGALIKWLAFVPDEPMLLALVGAQLQAFTTPSLDPVSHQWQGKYNSGALSHDGRQLALGVTVNDTIELWNRTEQQLINTLTGHDATVSTLAFSPDGELLASGGDDRKIRTWDTTTAKQLHLMSGHRDRLRSVAFSPDGRLLLSTGWDTRLTLWHLDSGQSLFQLPKHLGPWMDGYISRNGHHLVAHSPRGEVQIFDLTMPTAVTR